MRSAKTLRLLPADESRPNLFDFSARTVREIVDWYCNQPDAMGTNAVSVKERRRILDLFASRYGDWPIAKCRPVLLSTFMTDLERARGQPASKWTRKRWAGTVQCAFNAGAKLGLIDRNPFTGLTLPCGENGRDLTDAEFRSLLRLASAPFRRVLFFVRYTGVRPGELRELTLDQVDLVKRVLLQKKHKTAHKTGRPRRIVLPQVAVNLLHWLTPRAGPDGHLFLNSRGCPWRIGSLCKNLRTLREAAGLPADAKLYGARHAFATTLIVNGVPTATVAELLGHSGLQTVQRYVHLADKHGHLLDAVESAKSRKPKSTS